MSNKKFSTFNDGIVAIYREKDKRTGFGAKQNVASLDDMIFVARLDYEECSKREQDLEFANQHSRTLSIKLKTRYVPVVNNKCQAVIDGYLYDIWSVDKAKTEMYLYMEGVKPLVSE